MDAPHTFTLPKGYVDSDGEIHREGTLRPARAGDEVAVLGDPRVQANRAYVVVLLLARVIEKLGSLEGDEVTPELVESLYSVDFAYLQERYRELNGEPGSAKLCPHCGKAV